MNELELFSKTICTDIQKMVQYIVETANLENVNMKDETQNAPFEENMEGNTMAYKRVKVLIGSDTNNNPVYVWVNGDTQD